ncbi:unnamed protein product [Lactuca virosa]|uniref:Bet v I/Major latex protein domain-containing protein n=1 Tax=Lactuca virosa TaxID=75947 RepID=A0AAU9NQU8_9ASTR|nr:unnamed protein product [Lactuca virosa]
MSPMNIKSVDLNGGEWGYVGSGMTWNYIFDGKTCVAKEVIEAIDEEKKSVSFKVVDGALMEFYKTFLLTVQVDTKEEKNFVTWTLTYEKINGNIKDPNTLMEFCLNVTKDIETNLHMQCN